MSAKVNHRHTPRVPCEMPARAEGPRGPIRGFCRSISQGGLFFSGASLPIGQRVEVQVEVNGRPVSAVGEVRYHHASREGLGMGIKFTRLSQEDLAVVMNFVQQGAGA